MAKKLIVLSGVVVVLVALIAPGAAQATPVLTSSGVKIAVGTPITATADDSSVRLVTDTGLGVLECEGYMLNAEVTLNSGSAIAMDGPAGSTTVGCSFEGIETATVRNISFKNLLTNMVEGETGTGSFEVSYEAEVHGGGLCKFSNTGKPGTFHYRLGTDRLIITRTNVSTAGCGESFLEGEITLETTNGSPVLIS